MRTLRALWRILAFVVVNLTLLLIFLLVKLFIFNNPDRYTRWRKFMVRIWAQSIAWIFNATVVVEGKRPKAPYFLVSNHLSYFDIIAYYTQLQCIFVARADVRNWPFFGVLTRSVNTLFIDRTLKKDVVRVNKLIDEAMDKFGGVMFFPEGTSTKGEELAPFKAPLFEMAAKREAPVSCAYLRYDGSSKDAPPHRTICWWDDTSFPLHVWRLLKTTKIVATISFIPGTIKSNDRKVLARETFEKIQQNFKPTFITESS